MSEVFIFNQNKEVFNVKLEHVNVGLTTSYKIKLLVLYIYIYMYTKWCDFVQFSYRKTEHRTARCGTI